MPDARKVGSGSDNKSPEEAAWADGRPECGTSQALCVEQGGEEPMHRHGGSQHGRRLSG